MHIHVPDRNSIITVKSEAALPKPDRPCGQMKPENRVHSPSDISKALRKIHGPAGINSRLRTVMTWNTCTVMLSESIAFPPTSV